MSARHDPVVAARPLGIGRCLADDPVRPRRGVAPERSVRFGRDHRLLVRLAEQEFAIERPVSKDPPGQFGHDDHREPAGEVPAELALDGQAVDRRPRLGAVAEQVKLDRQPIAAVRDPGVDARRVRVQERSGLVWQPFEFIAGDPVQPDRSRDDVRRQTVRPEHFGQSSHPLASEVVHLEQPVLRHRVAEAEPEVVLPIRQDVRYAPTIPLDDHTGPYVSGHFTLTTWYPACGLAPPPGVELGTRPSHRSTDRIDRLAGPQPPQDVLWGDVHQSTNLGSSGFGLDLGAKRGCRRTCRGGRFVIIAREPRPVQGRPTEPTGDADSCNGTHHPNTGFSMYHRRLDAPGLSRNGQVEPIQVRKASSSTLRPLRTATRSPSPVRSNRRSSTAAMVMAPEGSVRRP